jgi:hypothetical protein
MASLGDNRGELARHGSDAWIYMGQTGEVLTLDVKADHPMDIKWTCRACGTPAMAYEDKFPAGILDTFLTVIAPDGRLLALADDGPSREDWLSSDTLIEAVYLPVDGPYRIEVSSVLDDLAGGYSLTLESRRAVDVDPAVLESYAGRYEWPWGVVTLSLEDGRLYYPLGSQKWVLVPLSDTEFITNPGIYKVIFERGEDGLVSGFVRIDDEDGRVGHVRLED